MSSKCDANLSRFSTFILPLSSPPGLPPRILKTGQTALDNASLSHARAINSFFFDSIVRRMASALPEVPLREDRATRQYDNQRQIYLQKNLVSQQLEKEF